MTDVRCSYCGQEVSDTNEARHEVLCVRGVETQAMVRNVLEDRTHPGYIVRARVYEVLARHFGLPKRTCLRKSFGSWGGVALFFNLKYDRYGEYAESAGVAAENEIDALWELELAGVLAGARAEKPRESRGLAVYAERMVRSFDAHAGRWVTDCALSVR